MKKLLLIVDDDPAIQTAIAVFFEAHGYAVITAADVATAQVAFRSRRPDAAIIDFILPDGDALTLLERFHAVDANCPTIVLTGHGSISLAVEAIQHGASHFLTKPVDLSALATVVERLLASEALRRKDVARHATSRSAPAPSPFLGDSAAIRDLESQVIRILHSDCPILITGETGAGKGVLARWIHANGSRASAPFVDLNCAGLSRELLDTELFGHEKGAFTGAVNSKAGLFEVAHGGTMFLDEIGDVDLQVQPKLLKVVDEKRFRRLGDVTDRTVDVRLIGATHRDLVGRAMCGDFRADLFFRLSTLPIHLPALRERVSDIPVLADAILQTIRRDGARRDMRMTASATAALLRYSWPGNIRELRNVIERAALLSDSNLIDAADLHLVGSRPYPHSLPHDDVELSLEDVERRHIELVLKHEDGHVDRAASRLGISRSSLYNKVRQYALRMPSKV